MRESECWSEEQALSDRCKCAARMNKGKQAVMRGRTAIILLLAGAAVFVMLIANNVIDAPSIEILDALDLTRGLF